MGMVLKIHFGNHSKYSTWYRNLQDIQEQTQQRRKCFTTETTTGDTPTAKLDTIFRTGFDQLAFKSPFINFTLHLVKHCNSYSCHFSILIWQAMTKIGIIQESTITICRF